MSINANFVFRPQQNYYSSVSAKIQNDFENRNPNINIQENIETVIKYQDRCETATKQKSKIE